MSQHAGKQICTSVIIPVFNDANRLALCLEALECQTYPREKYEIIVVDNGSKDNISDIVAKFKSVSLVQELQPGSYVARNKGISIAKGNYFAFTDSDCIPNSKWIENGIKALSSPTECGLVAGRIELFFKDQNSPTSVELYESIELDFSQQKLIETERFGLTANLFTTREVLEKVGIFDPSLKSGGDRDWGKRVFDAGYSQIYSADAFVKHPTRHSWWQLYKRVTRIKGGSYDLICAKLSAKERTAQFAKYLGLAITPPFRSLFKIWDDQRLKSRKQKVQFIVAMLFVRYISVWEHIRLELGGKSRRW